MNVIIPLAGLGTRLRPHTHTVPKPLVEVAGKPILGHILDQLTNLEIEEVHFIVGHLGNQIENYVQENYPQFKTRYIEQKQMLGQAHAIQLARQYNQKELLIIFGDTIFKTDLTSLKNIEADGVLHLREVENPARFGVALLDEQGFVIKLVEKPKTPISYLAVVGVYYIKDATWLFKIIDQQIATNQSLNGEFYLADALATMLEQGAKFQTRRIEVWQDCGTLEALLESNRYLLESNNYPIYNFPGSTILAPVYIGDNVTIKNSVIGPHVSIAANTQIQNCIIKDSIIGEKSVIENTLLNQSVIGSRAKVRGHFQSVNLSDDSEIQI